MSDDRFVLCVPRIAVASVGRFSADHWSLVGQLCRDRMAWWEPKREVDPPNPGAGPEPTVKQLVPYTLVADGWGGRVFTYRRKSREPGLDGRWSLGIGGHVEPCDDRAGTPIVDAIRRCRKRELGEELGLDDGEVLHTRHLGLINDDSDEVGRRHLGIAAVVYLERPDLIRPDPSEIAEWRWCRWGEWPSGTMESWSAILAHLPAGRIAR